MKWYQVQSALEEGQLVKEKSWIDSYIYFEHGKFYRAFESQAPERYMVEENDVLFGDWEIVGKRPVMKVFTASIGYCPYCNSLQFINLDAPKTRCGFCLRPVKCES